MRSSNNPLRERLVHFFTNLRTQDPEEPETFGQLFGGATAFPRAKGVWRDDEMGGVLVKDEPVVIHCYTTPAEIADPDCLNPLGSFCRRMGREARQGEVGLVIGDEYLAFRDFSQE